MRLLQARLDTLQGLSGQPEGAALEMLQDDTAKQMSATEKLYMAQIDELRSKHAQQRMDMEFDIEMLKKQLRDKNVVPVTTGKLWEARLDAQRNLDSSKERYKELIGHLTANYEKRIVTLNGDIKRLEGELKEKESRRQTEQSTIKVVQHSRDQDARENLENEIKQLQDELTKVRRGASTDAARGQVLEMQIPELEGEIQDLE